jgi:hypothetical protein
MTITEEGQAVIEHQQPQNIGLRADHSVAKHAISDVPPDTSRLGLKSFDDFSQSTSVRKHGRKVHAYFHVVQQGHVLVGKVQSSRDADEDSGDAHLCFFDLGFRNIRSASETLPDQFRDDRRPFSMQLPADRLPQFLGLWVLGTLLGTSYHCAKIFIISREPGIACQATRDRDEVA